MLSACAAAPKPLPASFETRYGASLKNAEWQEVGIGQSWNTGFPKLVDRIESEPQAWILTENLRREPTETGWKYTGNVGLVGFDDQYIETIYVFATRPRSEVSRDKAKILGVVEIPFGRQVEFSKEEDQIIPFELEWSDDRSAIHALYALALGKNGTAAVSTLNYGDGRAFPDPAGSK